MMMHLKQLYARLQTQNGLRFFRGILAQGYSQVITIVLQLISVPLLLHFWGTEQYGVWLTLSALPTYLALADLGFAQVAANEMTISVAANDRATAEVTFQSVLALIVGIGVVIFILAVLAAAFVPFSSFFNLGSSSSTTIFLVISLLSLSTVMSLFLGVVSAALRSEGQFATMIALLATARLVEQGAVLITASAGGSMVLASLGMVLCRGAITVAGVVLMMRVAPWAKLGFRKMEARAVRRLFLPSITFMAYTAGNLVNIQGVVLIVAAFFGPVAVATVSAMRTLVRLGPTVSNMISYALQPEYSALYGAGRMGRFRALIREHVYASIGLAAAYLFGLLLLSHWIISVWTHGRIIPVEPLLFLLILSSAAEIIWMSAQTPLIAVNKHPTAALSFLIISVLALGAIAVLARMFGLTSIGLSALVVSAVMIGVSAYRTYNEFFRHREAALAV